jgi:AcrR family transcriptional regulator
VESAPAPTPTARQVRAKETRARLFAAAAELFDAQGYHQTSVDQIAKRAQVAKGTFFLHFATKDAVIGELVRIQNRGARRARERVLEAGGSPLEALRALVMGLGQMAAMSRPLSRAVLTATLENPMLGGEAATLFKAVFDEMVIDCNRAQAEGLLDRTPDAETIAQVLMASYLGAALHFTSSPGAKELLEILTPIVDANLASFQKTIVKRGRRALVSRR